MPRCLVMQRRALSVGFIFWKLFLYDGSNHKQGEHGTGLQKALWLLDGGMVFSGVLSTSWGLSTPADQQAELWGLAEQPAHGGAGFRRLSSGTVSHYSWHRPSAAALGESTGCALQPKGGCRTSLSGMCWGEQWSLPKSLHPPGMAGSVVGRTAGAPSQRCEARTAASRNTGINGACWKHFRPAADFPSSCPIPVTVLICMNLPDSCPGTCCHSLSVRGKERPDSIRWRRWSFSVWVGAVSAWPTGSFRWSPKASAKACCVTWEHCNGKLITAAVWK